MDKEYKEIIDKAIEVNANGNPYGREIYFLKQFNSLEEFFNYNNQKEVAYHCYWYAIDIIRGRWLEAEKIIFNSREWVYWYINYLIKERCPEAEKTIMQSAGLSFLYAKYIIKGRWLEGENVILNDFYYSNLYRKELVNNN